MSNHWSMPFFSSLSKGIIGSFDSALKELFLINKLSEINDNSDEEKIDNKEVKILYSTVNENSSKAECNEVLNSLQKLFLEGNFNFDEHKTKVQECYEDFQQWRNFLHRKLAVPTDLWLREKWNERIYPQKIKKLQNEVESIEILLEQEKQQNEISVSEQIGKKVDRKLMHTEDFMSQHPLFIEANAREQIEFIQKFSEIKLAKLKDDERSSKEKLKEATKKHMDEIQKVIEETLDTRFFVEWLEKKRTEKLKEYEEEETAVWSQFSMELQECRSLCKNYIEIDEVFRKIQEERKIIEFEKKKHGAATTIQAHWRGYKVRKQLIEEHE